MRVEGLPAAQRCQRPAGGFAVEIGIMVHHHGLKRVARPDPAVALDAVEEELARAQLHRARRNIVDSIEPLVAACKGRAHRQPVDFLFEPDAAPLHRPVRAQIAHVARHVMADHQLAILEIVVDFIRAAGKNVAAGQLFQLIYAQAVHLARIAVDRLGLEIHVLAAHAPPVDDQIGQLNDPAGVHAVELHVQRDHSIRLFKQVP